VPAGPRVGELGGGFVDDAGWAAAGLESPEGGGGVELPAMRASPAGGADGAGPPDPGEGGGSAGGPAMGAIPGVAPHVGRGGAANAAL
jgi:hypothetical protein